MKESDRNEVKRGEWITYKQFIYFLNYVLATEFTI